ncbi:MAG: pyrroline-5-carboxylate reductase [Spirochaetales bacterium]|nr:pyrroline-5-carboxylate reductase [Spirochaetales bacterium]
MNIGFIGSGNMATAIVGGLLNTGKVTAGEVFVSDASKEALDRMAGRFSGIHTSTDNLEHLDKLDYLFLSVKPHIYEPVIRQIRDKVAPGTVVITIAAGKSREQVTALFGREIKLVRTMPNTPALVGEGMTAVCPSDNLSQDEVDAVLSLLGSYGKTEVLEERLIDGYTAMCGSSPAYVYMFIEALADGGVREGLPRDKAYKMAAQAVLGSAKMVLETGTHPGQLKDQVCSPGGSTIEAVGVLEEKGFRSAVMEALRVCAWKSGKLSES